MTRKETIILLNVWLETYHELDMQYESLRKLVGGNAESPLFNATYRAFERYTDMLAKLVGDRDGWLCWFLYENDCGEKGHEATINGKTINVRCVKDLERVIRLHWNHTK